MPKPPPHPSFAAHAAHAARGGWLDRLLIALLRRPAVRAVVTAMVRAELEADLNRHRPVSHAVRR